MKISIGNCFITITAIMTLLLSVNAQRMLQTNSTIAANNTSTVVPSTPTTGNSSTVVPSTPANNISTVVPPTPVISVSNNDTAVSEDALSVYIYTSKLTSNQRAEYMDWVKYKDSLHTNLGQLAKTTKYFAPENPSYFQSVVTSGWPFYLLSAFCGAALLLYLIMRFLFGSFQGPKHHITQWFGYFTYGLVGT